MELVIVMKNYRVKLPLLVICILLYSQFIAPLNASRAADATQFFTTKTNGDHVHRPTGVTFPSTIGIFSRSDLRAFDEIGHNVSVGYKAKGKCTVEATAYVYPREGEDTARHVEALASVVEQRHQGAKLIVKETYSYVQGKSHHSGMRLVHQYGEPFYGRHRELQSETYLLVVGSWFVKHRITYPQAESSCARAGIESLIGSIYIPPSIGKARTSKEQVQRDINRIKNEELTSASGIGDVYDRVFAYGNDSDDVIISMSHKTMSWMTKNDPYTKLLVTGYFAGNIEAQFKHRTKKSFAYEGVLSMIGVYNKIRKKQPGYFIKEIDDMIQMEKAHKLKAYLASSP